MGETSHERDMAKANMKQVAIPKFSSEAEEAAWWDAHRSRIEAGICQRIKRRVLVTKVSLASSKPASDNRDGRIVAQKELHGRSQTKAPAGRPVRGAG